mmetsp:Transcript_1548/g.2316  ORF Transcript_1548/g.2316 Transcript_1548/m.2316 type:complete len:134 (+) Transcript_1548:55-456(+)
MVSALEGRWLLEDENGDTTIALISENGEVKFMEDPEAEMRIAEPNPGTPEFLLLSSDGEELCQVKLVEAESGPTLQLQGQDGHTETWRKIRQDAPKTVSRKKGALPRIFTKEGQQGSAAPPAPEGETAEGAQG